MGKSRLELQTLLESILGSRQVYYQPPESIKLSYPCIVYKKDDIWVDNADDSKYRKMTRYQIIVMSQRPDNPVIEKIHDLPYCSYDRQYATNNLNHDVLTLYY